ncbi:MAG: replicative DNA helicase [Deltaproteobacteria bacterium]
MATPLDGSFGGTSPQGEPGDPSRPSGGMPWDREAERAVLGAVLLDNDVFDDISSLLKAQDFYQPQHRQIFEAMVALRADGEAMDHLTVPARMRRLQESLDEVNVRTYVLGLDSGLATSANAAHWARIVRRESRRRSIREAAGKILELAKDPTTEIEALSAGAEQTLFEATQQTVGQDLRSMKDILPEVVRSLEELMKAPSGVTGISTGLVDLDRKTTGLHGGELVIVAGRPGMGKTTLALNMAVHAAVRENRVVAIFSLEMPEVQLVQRILASEALVDAQKLRTGDINQYDWNKLMEQSTRLFKTNLFLDGSPVLTATQIGSKSRKLKSRLKGALDLIVVDYLQLMEAPAMRRESSRAEDVALMSRALKQLAKELNLPVVALAQLSRDVEKKGRKPMLSDLRESGAIEQDADVVLFIHRDETEQVDGGPERPTELILGKQRSGPVGTVEVLFQREFNRFVNLDRPPEG